MSEAQEQPVEETVYEKIVAFLGVEYNGEEKNEYIKQLAQLLNGSSDEQWEKLDPAAKAWYNDFATAYTDNEDNADWVAPDIEGLDDAIATYVPSEKPAKAAKGSKAAKVPKEPKAPKAAKEPKAPKEPKPPKESTPSNSGTMREVLADSYDMTLDELMAALEAKGVVAKRSSVHIVWFNTQRILEAVVAKGSFKNKAGETFTVSKS